MVAALSAGVQLLLTAEYIPQCDRSGNTFQFVSSYSFMPRSFLVFLIPWSSRLLGVKAEIARENYFIPLQWEGAGYVGILTLILAGWSFGIRGHRSLWAARILLVTAAVLMLGRYTPIYEWLFHYLPGLGLFRIPSRAIVIMVWALCVMAACGFDHLLQAGTDRWRRRAWRWSTMAVCVSLSGGLLAAFKYLHLTKTLSNTVTMGTADSMLEGHFRPAHSPADLLPVGTAAVLAILDA